MSERYGQKRPDFRGGSYESIWNTKFGTTAFLPPREEKMQDSIWVFKGNKEKGASFP